MAWPSSKDHQSSKNRGTLGPFKAAGGGKEGGGANRANLEKDKAGARDESPRPRPWVAGFSKGAPKSDYGKGGN